MLIYKYILILIFGLIIFSRKYILIINLKLTYLLNLLELNIQYFTKYLLQSK